MSVQFADGKPSTSDLATFATRLASSDIGNDGIEELGDDLGIGLISNSSKAAMSPARQVSIGGSSSGGEMPSISIKPVDDLGVIDIDAGPGVSDIRINREESSSAPFSMGASFDMGASNGDNIAPRVSAEDERHEKQKYLAKLQRLEASGIKGQRMTMANSLDEIKAEHDKLVDSKNLEASIRFQRNALMTFVSGVEMVNDKFGNRLPVKPRLKGWSESVHTNIEDFDEIFEELYDLYKDRAKMHPLLRLGGTLGLSATMYHLTNTMAERSGIPGMADLLNEDPALRAHFAQAAASKIGGGLGSFMSTGMPSPPPQPQGPLYGGQQGPPPPMQNRGQPLFGGSSAAESAPATSPVPQARREMRGPANVDDVLRAFEAERMMQQASASSIPISQAHAGVFVPSGSGPASPQTAESLRFGLGGGVDPLADISVPDTQSIGSASTMNPDRRRRRRQATPVGEVLNLNI